MESSTKNVTLNDDGIDQHVTCLHRYAELQSKYTRSVSFLGVAKCDKI
jgi:hypothetical protein